MARATAVVVFVDVIFVVAFFAVFTVRIFEVGSPAVVFHVKLLGQVHQLFYLRVDQLRLQRAFAQDVAADDGVALFHFQLFRLGHFVTQLEGFHGHFFQRVEIIRREMVLDGVQRVRIATVFQQLFNNQTRLFALLFQ